jgi:hypothetical protein
MSKYLLFIRLLAATLLFAAAGAYAADTVILYKRASCGCCGGWADHMRAAGFRVNVMEVADPGEIRRQHGIPDVATCHTAVVNGYAIEGHVPAREVKRLLAERPKARGLALPRMPIGAPGMEQGNRVDPYDVFLVQADGSFTVYARYGR